MADFKLSVEDPHAPKGAELEIPVIGVVANGDSVTVTQEMQDQWAAQYPDIDMKKSLAQNGSLSFSGSDKLREAVNPIVAPEPAETSTEAESGGEK